MPTDKQSHIAVTGGTGFLGSHILRGLLESGYENIVALKRSDSKMDLVQDIMSHITWIEGDILDIKSLDQLMQDAKYVIHSAALVSYQSGAEDDLMAINVEGTANVVNTALALDLEKLIFISSVAALGRSKPGTLIDETVTWSENSKTTAYGRSKHLAEMEVWRGMYEGLPMGILNPSMILGPSYWGSSSTKLITHVANGSRFYPSGSNGFVDVRDLAELTIRFLESEEKNQRIIAVGDMASYKELFEMIAKELNIKAPSVEMKGWLSQVAWRLLSLTKDPVITKETVDISSQHFLYDASRSKELFDFQYRSLQQTIKDVCAEYTQNRADKQDLGYFEKINH